MARVNITIPDELLAQAALAGERGGVVLTTDPQDLAALADHAVTSVSVVAV